LCQTIGNDDQRAKVPKVLRAFHAPRSAFAEQKRNFT
jgi:hypothetical protein